MQNAEFTPEELVPLTLVALELDEPIELVADGLADEIMLDDIGMRAVPAAVARRFFAERREQADRMAQQSRRIEEAHKRLPVGRGVPAREGLSAIESMMSEPDFTSVAQEFGRPRPAFLEEQLEAGAREQAAARAEAAARMARRELEGRNEK